MLTERRKNNVITRHIDDRYCVGTNFVRPRKSKNQRKIYVFVWTNTVRPYDNPRKSIF